MSVRGKLDPKWDITYYEATSDDEGQLVRQVLSGAGPLTVVDGVGDGARATHVLYSQRRTLATTKADVWDLIHASGVNVVYDGGAAEYLDDPGNEVVVLTSAVGKLKAIQIEHHTPSATNSVTVAGTLFGGANLLFLVATDGVNLRPGGYITAYAPGGYLLTAGADTMTCTNLGAANVEYSIKFLFATS